MPQKANKGLWDRIAPMWDRIATVPHCRVAVPQNHFVVPHCRVVVPQNHFVVPQNGFARAESDLAARYPDVDAGSGSVA